MDDLLYGAVAGDMNALNLLFILGLPIVLVIECVVFFYRKAKK